MKKNIAVTILIIVIIVGVLIGLYQFNKLKAEYASDLKILRSELQLEKEARQTEKEAYQDTLRELKEKQKKVLSKAEQISYNNGYINGKAQAKTIKTYQDPVGADVTENGIKINYSDGTGYYLEKDQINRHEK